MVSTLFSIAPLTSLRDNKELFLFLLFPIFWLVLKEPGRQALSLRVVQVSALLSALVGLFSVLRKGILLYDRLTGFTSHWMTYAGLLMLVFVFSVVERWLDKGKKGDWFSLAVLAVILAAILCSLTRSVWLGVFVALLLFILCQRPRLLAAALPVGLALLLLLPASVKSRFLSIVDLHDESNRDRLHMVHTGWQIFRHYPLTGVGANNVPQVYGRFLHPDSDKINMHLHNNFLQTLAERGPATTLCLLLAFVFIFIELARRAKAANAPARYWAHASLYAFVAFVVAGFFEYNFGDSEIKALLFYFLALPLAAAAGGDQGGNGERDVEPAAV